MMKKILGILVLCLFWCNISFAQSKCTNYIDYDATYVDSSFNKTSAEEAWYMYYEFKSTSDKEIKISSLFLKTENGQEIVREKLTDTYIKPFGVRNSAIAIKQINKDVISKAGFSCRYESQQVSSNSTKQKKTPAKQSVSTFSPLTGYSSLLIMAGIIIAGLLFYIKSLSIKNKEETKSKKKKFYKSNIKKSNYSSSNFVSTVWNGEETMSKTFWLYCVLIVAIVSFISGLALSVVGNIIWVVPLSVIIWTNTGLWRSSSFYQNQKLKNKQPYGWASAAKVYVIINYILTFSQIGLSLRV